MSTACSVGAAFAVAAGLTAVAAPGAAKQVDASVCPAGYDPLTAFCLDKRTGDIVNQFDITNKAAGDCEGRSERLGELCFDPVSGDIENPRRKEAIP
ncbi:MULTISPECIES: hypothetical protein [unclassified Chelatococcus]|uniref:hypothetical protein n=1 Tax=unclassified Chelatococcus TaxID=2638111 RepID=UPI001BCAA168|nr:MULTISPECIES: hypothetical protein [unclassified Chelatococcus]CAH1654596.1 conserved exported hypothetical protein [Hyphomicrobiales bacterium]MBS7740270.1 hypothetical protein [Chelatococcus sp. HY11]MBX3544900.1 hypothetical protein [Chelatococcus sp.]MCO5078489.1 hypothetical protein [Chelatococcus sp.]CAH1685372.1 conserved exported hypothetical protein [Hyphomicrobiales bacterium]